MSTSTTGEVRAYYHRVLPFYEAELRDRGDEELWAWAASAPAGCRVLEVGAGSGRATAHLAQTASSVVAFDLAPEMIAVARRRLAARRNVELLVADLRGFRFAARFDLVAAVDDPFVHLTADADRERAFAAIAAHLAPGGRFLRGAAWLAPGRRAAAEGGGLVEERRAAGGLAIRETWRRTPESRLCTSRFEYRVAGRLEAQAAFPARLWSRDELAERCRAAGLAVAHLWGDFDRRPWDRESSPRLIAEIRPL